MRDRQLGESGLIVSAVGLGCNNFGWRIDARAARAVVDAAIDAGITLFDTADSYGGRGGSERMLGEALKGRRDDVVVATKFGSNMAGANGPEWEARGSRRYIRRAVEGSLRRLQTDHIDLYQQHWPDPRTPIAETIATLDELVREGKVRYVGASNSSAWRFVDYYWTARELGAGRFVSEQSEYSLLERGIEAELVPACERCGAGVLPYFPLASGLLTGKYRRGEPAPAGARLEGDARLADDSLRRVEALEAFAAERGTDLLSVAIGGLAAQPAVASVIAGATTPEQVHANAAAGDWRPSPQDLAALDEVAPPRRSGERSG